LPLTAYRARRESPVRVFAKLVDVATKPPDGAGCRDGVRDEETRGSRQPSGKPLSGEAGTHADRREPHLLHLICDERPLVVHR
jgi:hypothetical protein